MTRIQRMGMLRKLVVTLATAAAGTGFLASGCSPEVQATIESGTIAATQAGLGSFYTALANIFGDYVQSR